MRLHLLIFAPLLMVGLGCHGQTAEQQAHRDAPIPPPKVDTPVDPVLLANADRELTDALRSPDPVVRAHGIEAVTTSNSARHNAELLQLLHDPAAEVRFAAAVAIGQLKVAEAHDALLAMAPDKSPNVRVAVRFALHRLGDMHLSHDLEDYSRYLADPRVRGNTAMVLGLLGEPSAIKILKVLRGDPEPAVRQNAEEAMWRLGDEDAMADLIALTISRYPDDQAIAYAALAAPRNTRVRQYVRAGLVSYQDWAEVPLVAARAMGMLGSDEGYAIAQAGAKSPDLRQRELAALAFGAIGRADAQPILRTLLTDPQAEVRIAAATAILQLKSN